MKLRELISAYNRLGGATMTKLDDKDVVKALKARKAMRPHAEEYEAFLKDCQEKFKPEGWDDIQAKAQQWQQEGEETKLTIEERKAINKALATYQKNIDSAVKEELEKDIVINIEKLSEGSDVKLMQENKWKPFELDELDMLF